MTKRRIVIGVLAAVLPFLLTVLGSYLVEAHTTDGRLAMWIVMHSQKMTDQELAHAIGQDPFGVLRRAGLMTSAIAPVTALIVGVLVACFERQIPGKLTAIVLTPYFLWDFSMSAFSVVRTPAQTVLKVGKVLGTDIVWVALAVLASLVVVRLFARIRPLHVQVSA